LSKEKNLNVETPRLRLTRPPVRRYIPSLYIPGILVSLAQGLAMPYAQAGAMAVDTELAGSASGAVVFSQFFWPAALQQLTGLLANGTWVPMAVVQFAAVTGALLASCIAVRAKD
jgi:DHA1 family bicyclomycin/chloramphenicol resistance-like MFS transporter